MESQTDLPRAAATVRCGGCKTPLGKKFHCYNKEFLPFRVPFLQIFRPGNKSSLGQPLDPQIVSEHLLWHIC